MTNDDLEAAVAAWARQPAERVPPGTMMFTALALHCQQCSATTATPGVNVVLSALDHPHGYLGFTAHQPDCPHIDQPGTVVGAWWELPSPYYTLEAGQSRGA